MMRSTMLKGLGLLAAFLAAGAGNIQMRRFIPSPRVHHFNRNRYRKPHASGQECLRRAVGGWGFRKRWTGLTKMETLQALAPHGRIPLERAIALVYGMEKA